MSVYSGQVNDDPIGRPLDERLHLSGAMLVADDNTYNPEVFAVPSGQAGRLNLLFPIPLYTSYQTLENTSVNNPFYQGVYFQKNAHCMNQEVFDLGVITEDSERIFELWVPKKTKAIVESVGISTEVVGVTVVGIAAGDWFIPYEEKQITLRVAQYGSTSLASLFYIKFVGDPVTYYLALGGARSGASFSFEPNWAEGITVERRFLTSVFQAHDMTETRKILRASPVRAMESTMVVGNKLDAESVWVAIRSSAAMDSWQPWFVDRAVLTQAPDNLRLYCDTSYRRFQEGGYCFLVRRGVPTGYLYYELAQIAEVFPDGLRVANPLGQAFDTNDAVFPAFRCRAAIDGNELDLFTDYKGTYNIVSEEVYASDMLSIENSGYVPVIRRELPVFAPEVTWGEGTVQTIHQGGESKESGRGFRQVLRGVPYVGQTLTALSRTKEECWDTIGFFNYIQGRGKPFWVKSAFEHMTIKDTNLNISFVVRTSQPLAVGDYLKYVWVEDSLGVFDVLKIAEHTPALGGVQCFLETNTLFDIRSVHQAFAVRMSEDVLTEEYLTDSVMLTTITVQELQGVD